MSNPSTSSRTFFWQRLYAPGHDVCRLLRIAEGWSLSGTAVFRDGKRIYDLSYQVVVDEQWRTTRATVSGHRDAHEIDLHIRPAGKKTGRLGEESIQLPTECTDLDLGFTPATNLIAIRRLRLKVGEAAEAPAAWLSLPSMRLKILPQTYRRIGARIYAYEAPTVGYRGRLEVSSVGAVVSYPRLFKAVD